MSFLIVGCMTSNNIINKDKKTTNISSFSFLSSLSSGGIIEDTEIDAVSGATSLTYSAGVHSEINIRGHILETGLDYISFKQDFTYLDHSQGIDGTRDFSYHQLRLPVTYNFQFFKNNENKPLLIFKAGLSVGYTFSKTITDNGALPDYRMNKFNFAPTIGLASYPIKINNKYDLGFYLDLFRSGKFYEDVYNKEMGNLSNLKFGLILRFQNF